MSIGMCYSIELICGSAIESYGSAYDALLHSISKRMVLDQMLPSQAHAGTELSVLVLFGACLDINIDECRFEKRLFLMQAEVDPQRLEPHARASTAVDEALERVVLAMATCPYPRLQGRVLGPIA